ARERTDTLVHTVVLADRKPFAPLCVERTGGGQTQLFAKEVKVEGRRYIVCRNEAEAAKDAVDRQAIVAGLEQQLKRGSRPQPSESDVKEQECSQALTLPPAG
ncbi:MAG: hypothetical protein JOY91_06830, partial [Sinobacteraceae bacterium]|nr:hypothetical protein [Nevskiaceae bacterium]